MAGWWVGERDGRRTGWREGGRDGRGWERRRKRSMRWEVGWRAGLEDEGGREGLVGRTKGRRGGIFVCVCLCLRWEERVGEGRGWGEREGRGKGGGKGEEISRLWLPISHWSSEWVFDKRLVLDGACLWTYSTEMTLPENGEKSG